MYILPMYTKLTKKKTLFYPYKSKNSTPNSMMFTIFIIITLNALNIYIIHYTLFFFLLFIFTLNILVPNFQTSLFDQIIFIHIKSKEKIRKFKMAINKLQHLDKANLRIRWKFQISTNMFNRITTKNITNVNKNH